MTSSLTLPLLATKSPLPQLPTAERPRRLLACITRREALTAGLPDGEIRGSLEDAQDGSGACRSTQSAGGGPAAAGGPVSDGLRGYGSQVPGASSAGSPIGGKQRLTATRLHALLAAEGHAVGVTVIKDAVADHKAA